MREAARVLVEARVHGAPVIDAEGRLVGIVSIGIVTPTDVLRAAVNLQEGFRLRPTPAGEPGAPDGRGP